MSLFEEYFHKIISCVVQGFIVHGTIVHGAIVHGTIVRGTILCMGLLCMGLTEVCVSVFLFKRIADHTAVLYLANSKTWTQTLENPEKPGPSKTWTLKNMGPEKHGVIMGLKNISDFR